MGDYESYINNGDKSFHTEIIDLQKIIFELESIGVNVKEYKEFLEKCEKDFFELHLDGVKRKVRDYFDKLNEKYGNILFIKRNRSLH